MRPHCAGASGGEPRGPLVIGRAGHGGVEPGPQGRAAALKDAAAAAACAGAERPEASVDAKKDAKKDAMAAAGGSRRAPGLRLGLPLAARLPAGSSREGGGEDGLGEKTSGNNDWFQNSRVPSFAQMLKKNLPVQPSAQTVTISTGYSSSDSCSLSSMASKVTQVTGNFPEPLLSKGLSSISHPVLPPKKIPKEFIMKYKRGEINPVSALHQFAQMQRVQLDLKETVTT
ncbi:Hypothetical predicted protein, partial [Marmota monax]